MVVAKAYSRVDMGPGGSDYLPLVYPFPLVFASSGRVDILDSQGRLQRYWGAFNLEDLSNRNPETSVFTGYQQFAGASDSSPLLYEISGGSLNGKLVFGYLGAGNVPGLVAEVFRLSDQIHGSTLSDTLLGFAGNDVIDCDGGDDSACGGDGNDSIDGGLGADSLDGGPGNDTLRGGQGPDVILGGDGGDLLAGGGGHDLLNGGLGGDTLDGGAGRDTLRGAMGDDLITGGDGDDALMGGLGADTLNGGAGNDTLTGGLGEDRFILSDGTDWIADFNAAEGDKIAVPSATLPYSLLDSVDGLHLIRAGVGATTLIGITAANFDAASSIVFI